jgi:hypothetical protein
MIPASMVAGLSAGVQRTLNFSLTNIGVCEDPPGSNRSPEIDAWAKEFGSPVGSFWCALAVAKARREGGLWVPERYAGSCDEWWYAALRAGLTATRPSCGAAVVYTNGRTLHGGRYDGQPDAVHIGLVLRVTPVLLSIEGNTTLGKYDRDGFVQALKRVDESRVMGYIHPGDAA